MAMVGKQLDGTCEGRHASRLPGCQAARLQDAGAWKIRWAMLLVSRVLQDEDGIDATQECIRDHL